MTGLAFGCMGATTAFASDRGVGPRRRSSAPERLARASSSPRRRTAHVRRRSGAFLPHAAPVLRPTPRVRRARTAAGRSPRSAAASLRAGRWSRPLRARSSGARSALSHPQPPPRLPPVVLPPPVASFGSRSAGRRQDRRDHLIGRNGVASAQTWTPQASRRRRDDVAIANLRTAFVRSPFLATLVPCMRCPNSSHLIRGRSSLSMWPSPLLTLRSL